MASAYPLPPPPHLSLDEPGDARFGEKTAGEPLVCDACDEVIEGEPGGEGVYLWTRGDEVRRELAPLCVQCATAIGVSALNALEIEEEDG